MHCKACLWLSRSHVCITKGVSLPCLDYFNLPVTLPNCSLWIYNLQIHNHNLQVQSCLWLVKMTIIHHFQAVNTHNLMLHYNQMLSSLEHRCQGKGTAEAQCWGWAKASPAQGHERQLLAAPGPHCRPDPAMLRDTMLPHLPTWAYAKQHFSPPATPLYQQTENTRVWERTPRSGTGPFWPPDLAAEPAWGPSAVQARRYETWGACLLAPSPTGDSKQGAWTHSLSGVQSQTNLFCHEKQSRSTSLSGSDKIKVVSTTIIITGYILLYDSMN